MHKAVQQFATRHAAAAEAGADGDIHKIIQAFRRTPSQFAQRCTVDVSVETNRDTGLAN